MITLNVGLLLQILSLLVFLPLAYYLIFRPVQHVLQARDRLADSARSQAEQAARRASDLEDERLAALEAARRQGETRGRQVLDDQRRTADAALARAGQAGEELFLAAREELTHQVAAARRSARAEIEDLAARLARRLVEAEPSP